jgi:hypothetical protein
MFVPTITQVRFLSFVTSKTKSANKKVQEQKKNNDDHVPPFGFAAHDHEG